MCPWSLAEIEQDLSYQLTEYAHSLAEFGSPVRLPYSQGHVLLRPIPGTEFVDAIGCYPLFACRNAAALAQDLPFLQKSGAVSLTLVTDPLGGFDPEILVEAFTAVARPYKAHYLVDLSQQSDEMGTSHHRRNARRCARHAVFHTCAHPADRLDQWCELYAHLVDRHHITGEARFSRDAFAQQLSLPGVFLVEARNTEGDILGMQLWFYDRTKAWHHLSGYSPAGYRHGGVSYGLMAYALAQLKSRGIQVANLGAGAGLEADAADGLSRFKQGWSTHTRDAWLCGAALDPQRYASLSGNTSHSFFPAYRRPQVAESEPTPEANHVPAD